MSLSYGNSRQKELDEICFMNSQAELAQDGVRIYLDGFWGMTFFSGKNLPKFIKTSQIYKKILTQIFFFFKKVEP